jgi:ATPase subunit of ABC transporter with duplicated ATPase domains
MILTLSKLNKSIGSKVLLEGINFTLNKGEKVALIGRNGSGKTTLFKILAGLDKEFQGNLEYQSGLKITLTEQEHNLNEEITALDYILKDIPEYLTLQAQINDYELHGEDSEVSLEAYCEAVAIFSEKSYYETETEVLIALEEFQISEDRAKMPMSNLSGGEKRFVELVRIMFSECDLALIDEPTNHMDYVGKDKFIKWLQKTKETLFIISHDRDLLKYVDKVLELRDKQIEVYNGNYDDYIEKNSSSTSSQIKNYELGLRDIDKAKKQMLDARDHKMKAKSDKSRTAALIREKRFQKELDRLIESSKKPSFWIDKENLENLDKRTISSYNKYKDKNIRITNQSISSHKKLLLKVEKLSLGYEDRLFNDISFDIYSDDRIEIKGRNGAGKSTLIKSIIATIEEKEAIAKRFHGEIIIKNSVKLGVYDQEVNPALLELTLGEAIREIYYGLNMPFNDQMQSAILKQYLFDPMLDYKIKVKDLSGGQKARLQLIKMMANKPNLLILDEPTNHLDLPSIEELENTLNDFAGGIIYISHDSYFRKKIGGKLVQIGSQ